MFNFFNVFKKVVISKGKPSIFHVYWSPDAYFRINFYKHVKVR
jgi:hypothetical protein